MLKLILPEAFRLDSAAFQKMQWMNPGVILQLQGRELSIAENLLDFSKMNFVEIEFPFPITQDTYLRLDEMNPDLKKLEFHANKLQIHMGTIAFISGFSAAILIVIGIWNRKAKFGKIYDAQVGCILNGESHKMPDVALVKNTIQKHITERGFINGSPFLVVEVVSNKYSLQQDLQKMAEHWIASGTEIGLVVDPHRETYHLFELDSETYQSFSFQAVFSHDKLGGLEIDFDELLKEAAEE